MTPRVGFAADGPSWWWHSPVVQAELGLTAPQVQRLDEVYRRSLPHRRALRRQLDLAEAALAALLQRGPDDAGEAKALVNRVVDATRRRNIVRLMMLVEMYQVLQPGQRERLNLLANPISSP